MQRFKTYHQTPYTSTENQCILKSYITCGRKKADFAKNSQTTLNSVQKKKSQTNLNTDKSTTILFRSKPYPKKSQQSN